MYKELKNFSNGPFMRFTVHTFYELTYEKEYGFLKTSK